MSDDKNAKYLVLDYRIKSSRYRAYVLKPGEYFANFGGSRHDLCVKKTPSLIVRSEQAGCMTDTEYGTERRDIWTWLLRWAAVAAAAPYTDEQELIDAAAAAQEIANDEKRTG